MALLLKLSFGKIKIEDYNFFLRHCLGTTSLLGSNQFFYICLTINKVILRYSLPVALLVAE